MCKKETNAPLKEEAEEEIGEEETETPTDEEAVA
jgi:hypothetical protein